MSLRTACFAAVVVVAIGGVCVAAEPAPNDCHLTETQALYVEWTEQNFRDVLDQSFYADLSDAARGELEKKWIALLVEEATGARRSYRYCEAINALAMLRSEAAVEPLLRIAVDRRERDNRDRWMAVRALGLIGKREVVPDLIHLLYHYNQNTRFWAQISLVRLTGQNFGTDWEAWGEWWNSEGGQPAFKAERVAWSVSNPEWADPAKQAQADEQMIAKLKGVSTEQPVQVQPAQQAPAQQADATSSPQELRAAIDKEIEAHYSKASPEALEFMRLTAETFGRSGLWLPENAMEQLTPEQRDEKVKYAAEALQGEYGRHLCRLLAEAGALKDARLVPGLLKVANYQVEGQDYDCRPKWMAVAALGRLDDKSVIPDLIKLVDHGNQNVRLWSRATLARLTGENHDADKEAWTKWWEVNKGK